jgi:hypothetical protein
MRFDMVAASVGRARAGRALLPDWRRRAVRSTRVTRCMMAPDHAAGSVRPRVGPRPLEWWDMSEPS